MCAILLAILLGLSSFGSAVQPNILYILADDLGYADLSVQGWADLEFTTPHIDSIFTGGARFKAGYVSNSVCAPSRAGLLTGRSGNRFGFESNIPHAFAELPGSRIGLDPGQKTIADVLKGAGYKTYAIGKWHVGDNDDLFHPNLRGFDEFYGMIGGSRSYFQLTAYDHLDSVQSNGVWITEPEDMYVTDFLTDQALTYISDQTASHPDQPWFMYMSYTAPHSPMHAKAEDIARVPLANHFSGSSDNINRQIYGAMVVSMDDNVGRLLNSLDALGISSNTVVVFHSDNGGPLKGQNWSINSPLKGNKGSLWEGGVRVPFAISWPGTIPAGQVFDHDCPVSSLDMMPTFAAVSGADHIEEIRTDGINLMPLLTNAVTTSSPRMLFWRRGIKAQVAIRSGNWKFYHNRSNGEICLYDLSSGADESTNKKSTEPAILARLQSEYAEWEATLPDPAWGAWMENNGPLFAVTTYDLAEAVRTLPYNMPLTYSQRLTGAPAAWSILSGKPDWLSIDPATGTLSGTPSLTDAAYNYIQLQIFDGANTSIYNVPLRIAIDGDRDEIPDLWELEQFGGLAASNGGDDNYDGDRHSDWGEYIAGTDAANSASYFHPVLTSAGQGRLEVSFEAVSNRIYTLETSETLMTNSWNHADSAGPFPGNSQQTLQYIDPGNPDSLFGRITISLE